MCLRISLRAATALVLALSGLVLGDGSPVMVRVTVDTSRSPESAAWAEKAKRLVEEWYPRIAALLPGDGFTPPDHVTLRLQPMRGVAGTSRTSIVISSQWIKDHPDDFGMVIHELCHVVQLYPKPEPGWLVEGIADYIRCFHFEPDAARRSTRGGPAIAIPTRRPPPS